MSSGAGAGPEVTVPPKYPGSETLRGGGSARRKCALCLGIKTGTYRAEELYECDCHLLIVVPDVPEAGAPGPHKLVEVGGNNGGAHQAHPPYTPDQHSSYIAQVFCCVLTIPYKYLQQKKLQIQILLNF